MPGSGRKPAGGYKVVYEYANRLANDGYKVKIVYAASIFFRNANLKGKIKSILRFFYYLIWGYKGKIWFNLHPTIKESLVPSLAEKWVGKADAYIATAVQTAMYLRNYSQCKKLYLIQDYENWFVSDEVVNESYRYGFVNIAVSQWLKQKVSDAGADAFFIPNGFDFTYFNCLNSIEHRNTYHISMLYHKDERKGCKYGLEALEIIKAKFPNLKATLFGVSHRPTSLPKWIEYYRQPDRINLNRIYNDSAIYLAPSIQEGWGLTVGEAMICGAAVVCTDTLGFKEMVMNGTNGLIVPIADSKALANAIIKLMSDNSYRIQLAYRGHASIKNFTWDKSYDKFKSILETK